MKTFLEETVQFESEVCRFGLNNVLEMVWDIINDKQSSEKAILQALVLAKDCYVTRMHLLESQNGINREIEAVILPPNAFDCEPIESNGRTD